MLDSTTRPGSLTSSLKSKTLQPRELQIHIGKRTDQEAGILAALPRQNLENSLHDLKP